ncbi:MAG: helix-turn-helix transcriptional regulator [Coriobacteriia bacterium]|nr:helix-turn-helix transcriptional regulator [Coriobacteriia bacterium]
MDCHKTLIHNGIKYREFKGLTQEALAHKAGIDPSYVSKIERFAISPTMETYERLCSAMDTTVAYLMIEGIFNYFEETATLILQNGKYSIKEV